MVSTIAAMLFRRAGPTRAYCRTASAAHGRTTTPSDRRAMSFVIHARDAAVGTVRGASPCIDLLAYCTYVCKSF